MLMQRFVKCSTNPLLEMKCHSSMRLMNLHFLQQLDEETLSSAASEAEVFVSMKMNAEFGGLDLDVLAGDSGLLKACLKDLVLSFRQCTDDSISLTSCLASFFGECSSLIF